MGGIVDQDGSRSQLCLHSLHDVQRSFGCPEIEHQVLTAHACCLHLSLQVAWSVFLQPFQEKRFCLLAHLRCAIAFNVSSNPRIVNQLRVSPVTTISTCCN